MASSYEARVVVSNIEHRFGQIEDHLKRIKRYIDEGGSIDDFYFHELKRVESSFLNAEGELRELERRISMASAR